MKRYCRALDLVDDPALIEKYIWHHAPENHWPELHPLLRESGVISMEIYRFGTRMFMIMDVDDTFSFERMEQVHQHPVSQEWEKLMWQFQKPVPGAREGEKWVLMERVFQFPVQAS